MRLNYAEKLSEIVQDERKRQEVCKGSYLLLREIREKLEIVAAIEERDCHYQIDLLEALLSNQEFIERLIAGQYETLPQAIKAAKTMRAYVKRETDL